MPTLFSWYLTAHGPDFLARGIVSGHPRLPEGHSIHTSFLVRAEETEDGLLLETRSGSRYCLRPEELSAEAGGPGRSLPAPEALGLSPDFWRRCVSARDRSERDRAAALEALRISGALSLRIVGTTALPALWCGREGRVRCVQPAVHLGMFQDSVLIRDYFEDADGPCLLDFRYVPLGDSLEPYGISETVKTIFIANNGVRDFVFGRGEHRVLCPEGTTVTIDTADWWRERL